MAADDSATTAPADGQPDTPEEPADPEREAVRRWIAARLAEAPEPSRLTISIIVSVLAPKDTSVGDDTA